MSTTSASPARRQFAVSQELVLLVALVVALAVLSVTANRFMTVGNLLNQGRLMTEVALVALPMTFIIITGGIDLSVGSMMGLTVILQDFGRPFNPKSVREPDIHAPLKLRKEGGLGLFFIRKLMDEVHFDFSKESGNQLTMVKRKEKAP